MSVQGWSKALAVALGLAGTGLAGFGVGRTGADRTTLTRLSPDETLRASLVEPGWRGLDRNFQLRLEDRARGTTTTIFRSPDEGDPSGTERLIWSKDGTKLLLVGRHFFVQDDLFLDNGDQAYLLYDLREKRAWLNAHELPDAPRLTAGMLDRVEFTEPVRWRGPPPALDGGRARVSP